MASEEIKAVVARLLELDKADQATIPLPDEATLNWVETEIGLQLPDDYRYLVQNAGNSGFSKELLWLSRDHPGHGNLVAHAASARARGLPQDWLPICHDNSDYYCILPDGSVEIWSHDGMFEERWPNLAAWVQQSYIGDR